MRCKACDALLTGEELKLIDPINGEPLDTCEDCLDASGSVGLDGFYDYDAYGDCDD